MPGKTEENPQERIQKIRLIFTLSAKLGHTPEEMKEFIGQHIGLGKPIKESSEIKKTAFSQITRSHRLMRS